MPMGERALAELESPWNDGLTRSCPACDAELSAEHLERALYGMTFSVWHERYERTRRVFPSLGGAIAQLIIKGPYFRDDWMREWVFVHCSDCHAELCVRNPGHGTRIWRTIGLVATIALAAGSVVFWMLELEPWARLR